MRRHLILCLILICSIVSIAGVSSAEKTDSPKDVLVIQGKILDSAGNALSEANILPYLNGKPFLAAGHGAEAEKDYATGKNGLFRIEIPTTEDKIKSGKWEIKVTRPSFKPSQLDDFEGFRTMAFQRMVYTGGSPTPPFN